MSFSAFLASTPSVPAVPPAIVQPAASSSRVGPWRRVGRDLTGAATISEGIDRAGLSWTVRGEPLMIASDGRPVNAKAIIREDNGGILADAVGLGWQPLQNADAFERFRPLLEGGHVRLETAGELKGGRKVWILAELLRKPIVVGSGDVVKKYILLSNAHNDSMAVRIGWTSIRVVCQNTLTMAHREGIFASFRHTVNMPAGLSAAADTIVDAIDADIEGNRQAFERLASVRVPGAAALRDYVVKTFDLTPDRKRPGELAAKSQTLLNAVVHNYESNSALMGELLRADRERQEQQRDAMREANAGLLDAIIGNFETSPRAEGATSTAGTWWAAFNAATEFITHQRGKKGDDAARLDAGWFGAGAQQTSRALSLALQAAA